MKTPQQATRLYNRGDITQGELFWCLMKMATEDNAAAVIAAVPAELLKDFHANVMSHPNTDEGWAKLRWFHIGSVVRSRTREGNQTSEAREAEHRRLLRRGVEILQDVFGPRPLPLLDQSWLVWEAGTVLKLAETIYEERAFDRMPVLADALEEASCDNQAILRHCREQSNHVRACWVLDMLTGRQTALLQLGTTQRSWDNVISSYRESLDTPGGSGGQPMIDLIEWLARTSLSARVVAGRSMDRFYFGVPSTPSGQYQPTALVVIWLLPAGDFDWGVTGFPLLYNRMT